MKNGLHWCFCTILILPRETAPSFAYQKHKYLRVPPPGGLPPSRNCFVVAVVVDQTDVYIRRGDNQ